MKGIGKYLATSIVVAVAVILVLWKYWDYVVNPWTRDGQVRAEIIQVTPRVSGPVVELAIRDNQFVRRGDLLFRIDPRTFHVAVDQAAAELDITRDGYEAKIKQVEAAEANVNVALAAVNQAKTVINRIDAEIAKDRAEFERQRELLPQRATSQKSVDGAKAQFEISRAQREGALASLAQARASLAQAEADLAEQKASLGELGDNNANIRSAEATLKQAQLNLEFTDVIAPADGYVTNLNIRIGTQAVANQPVLALVDTASYWVDGFFRETSVEEINPGDQAVITLMSYPDAPIYGYVDSLGWGIAQQDGSTGFELLPNISPTFEWIRLAQRIPVKIRFSDVPEGVDLRVGTSASVLVISGTADSAVQSSVKPAPAALQ